MEMTVYNIYNMICLTSLSCYLNESLVSSLLDHGFSGEPLWKNNARLTTGAAWTRRSTKNERLEIGPAELVAIAKPRQTVT